MLDLNHFDSEVKSVYLGEQFYKDLSGALEDHQKTLLVEALIQDFELQTVIQEETMQANLLYSFLYRREKNVDFRPFVYLGVDSRWSEKELGAIVSEFGTQNFGFLYKSKGLADSKDFKNKLEKVNSGSEKGEKIRSLVEFEVGSKTQIEELRNLGFDRVILPGQTLYKGSGPYFSRSFNSN